MKDDTGHGDQRPIPQSSKNGSAPDEVVTAAKLIELTQDSEPGEVRIIVGGDEAAQIGYDEDLAKRRAEAALKRVVTERRFRKIRRRIGR